MSPPLRKILITGASGFLGWHLCQAARDRWQVFGLGRRRTIQLSGVTPLAADLTDFGTVKSLFSQINPAGVIHAAAVARTDLCQNSPASTWTINVSVSQFLAGICAEAGCPMVLVSTDLVFDGRSPPYTESDPPNPICRYGEQKAQAERAVWARHPHASICRLPLLAGTGCGPDPTFLAHTIKSLAAGRAVTLLTDEWRTPVDAKSAARGLLQALENRRTILHLGGRTRISRYELGVKIARRTGARTNLLIPASLDDSHWPAPRPADVSLDSSRAFGRGYDPVDLNDVLDRCIRAAQKQ